MSAGYLTVISPIFQVNVTPSVINSIYSTVPNGGQKDALLLGFPAYINGSGFIPGSTVQFETTSGGAWVVTPTSLTATVITVTVPDDTQNRSKVTILRPGATSLTSTLITVAGPIITGFSTTDGYAPGYNQDYLATGSSVTIYGSGFRPGTLVQFGPSGTANLIEPDLLVPATAVSPFGTSLTVSITSAAITGKVYLKFPSGQIVDSGSQIFTVHTYRNTFTLPFHNKKGDLTVDELEGEFPGQFGLVTAKAALDAAEVALAAGAVTGFFTLGLSTVALEAAVTTAAAVYAADLVFQGVVFDIADNAVSHGECYGFDVTSVLLANNPGLVAQFYQDQVSLGWSSPANSNPTMQDLLLTPELETEILENYCGQFSDEVLGAAVAWIKGNLLGLITDQFVHDEILGDLQQGQHPLISLQNAGHAVVAYDIEPGTMGNGDYYIDVYDPQRPETLNEDATGKESGDDTGDIVTAIDHLSIDNSSRIHIIPDVGWTYRHGTTDYTGGFGTLIVLPPSVEVSQGDLTLVDTVTDIPPILLGEGGGPMRLTTQPPATIVAGTPFSVTVTHIDDKGDVDTRFTGFDTVTDAAGGPLGGTTTVQAVNGVATFTGLTLSQAGPDFLNISSPGIPTVATDFFTVQAAPATRLVVITPAGTGAGETISSLFGVTVNAADAFGNVDTNFSGSVTLGLLDNPTGASLFTFGSPTVQAVNGVATFPYEEIGTPGSGYTLRATSAGLTAGTSTPFAISAGPAVVVTPPPSRVTAGTPFGLVVDVGEILSYNGSMTIALAPGGPPATLGGTLTVPVVQGVATFTSLTLNNAGSYSLILSGNGFTGTTTSVTVVGGTATRLAVTAQPTAVTTGSGFNLTVTAQDAFGNADPDFAGAVTLALATDPTGAALGGTLNATAIGGVARFSGLTLNKPGSGYTIQAAAGGLPLATSSAISAAAPGVATHLLVTTEPPTGVAAGSGFGLVVKAQDDLGAVDSTFNGAVSLASSAGGAALTVTTAVQGVATFSGITIERAGTYSLQITSNGLATATASPITISPAAATQVVVLPPDSNVITGFPFGLVAQAEDPYGNVDPTVVGRVVLTLASNPGGRHLGGTLTGQAFGGVVVFTGLTISSPGVGYQLQATGLGLRAGTSSPFTVTNDQMVIATEPPATVAAGTSFGLVVAAEDGHGNLDTSFNGQVSVALLASGPGVPTLGGTVTLTAVNGIATFSGLTLTQPGSYALSVTSPGQLSVITSPVNVEAAPATQLVVTVQPPAAVTVGAGFSFTVAAEDAYGNIDTSFNTLLALTLGNNPAGGRLTGILSATPVNGVATFSSLTLSQPGTGYTLQATSISGILSVTSRGINVFAPGVATQLVVTTPPFSSTTAGIGFGMVITAEDSFGTTATSFNGSITVSLSNSPTGGTLTGTVTVALVNGVASFAGLTLTPAGLYTLTASTTGLPAVTTNAFTIVAGPASSLVVLGPTSQVSPNVPFLLQVDVQDAEGRTVRNFSGNVTLTFGTNSGSATLGGTLTVAAVNGQALFDNLTISAPGIGYILQATATGLSTGATSAFDVAAEQLVATSLPPTSVAAGTGIGLVAKLETNNGTVDTSFDGVVTVSAAHLFPNLPTTLGETLTVTAVNGVASFSGLTLAQSGDYQISVSSAGLPTTTLTNLLEVSAGPATQLAVTLQAPQDVTTGAAFSVTVAAEDTLGNIDTSFNGPVSLALGNNPTDSVLGGLLTATAVNGVVTFSGITISKPGSAYTLQATSTDLTPVTSNGITVTAPAVATNLVVTTQPPATVTAGSGFGLVVRAENSLGALAPKFNGSVTITVANNADGFLVGGTRTVTAVNGVATFSGLTFPVAGAYALSVSSGGLAPATTDAITVHAGLATQLAVTRPSANVLPGVPFRSEVYALDPYGNVDPTFTGSVTIAPKTNPGRSTLGGTRTVNAVNGIAVFSDLTLNNLGDGYTLQGTTSGLAAGTSLPFDVAVVNPPVTLIPATLPAAGLGTPYAQLLAGLGGTGGDYTYAVTAGTLPAWLSLSASTGLLSGTVPATSRSPIGFTVTATDGNGDTGSQAYNLKVLALSNGGVLTYQAPSNQGPDDLVLRLNGSTLEIFDSNSQTVVRSLPLAQTNVVQIAGGAGVENSLTVDFSFGGFFTVAGGIAFTGGTGGSNSVRIVGTGQTTGSYTPDAATPGSGLAMVTLVHQSVTIAFAGIQPLGVTGMAKFQLVTPNSGDDVTVNTATGPGGQPSELITGTSGGVAFTSLSFSGIPAFTLDTGANDGADPDDVSSVKATLAGTNTTIDCSGADTVAIGDAGGVQDILGRLTVTSAVAHDVTLELNDQADGTGRVVTMASGSVSGLAPADIDYGPAALATLSVNGGTGANTFDVTATPAGTAVMINPGAGADRVNLGDALNRVGAILGTVSIDGQAGSDVVTINDQGASAVPDYTVTAGAVTRAGAATIDYSSLQSLVLNTASGGNTTDVASTAFGTPVTINTGRGKNTVNAGTPGNSLSNIFDLTVSGQGGGNTLNVNDQGAPPGQSYVVTATTLVRAGSTAITFSRIQNVVLNASPGGSGGPTYVDVQGTAAGTTLTVNAGILSDISIQNAGNTLDDVQGPVVVNGQVGDPFSVNDLGTALGHTYRLQAMPSISPTANRLTRSGAASITYTGLNSLQMTGGVGANVFNVESLADNFVTRIYGGGGLDVFKLSPQAQDLDNLSGILDLEGEFPGQTTANASLTLNDQSHTAARTWLFEADSLDVYPSEGSAAQGLQVYFNQFNKVVANGGGGGNVITVVAVAAGTPVTINAGSGNDAIDLGGGIPPVNADNPGGGPDPIQGPLTINGQGGVNTLDYSTHYGDVTVDLPLGIATDVAGGIRNIQDITGSQGNDLLVGNGGNVLTGGTGRNVLIAGAAPSTLVGNSGEDVLVGGTTAYDRNLSALDGLMAEWTRTDLSYGARVEDLLTGGGLNRLLPLNLSTFHSNGGGNTLTGAAGFDLFYGLLQGDTGTPDQTDWNAAQGETFIDPRGEEVGIVINAQAISGTSLTLDYYTSEPTATPFQVTLAAGSHLLQALDGQSSAAFTVNADGTVSYDSSLQGILTGQGTEQLTVNGAAVTIDARAVSGALLTLDYYTSEATGTPFKVGLLPGAHLLQALDGQSSVAFAVDADGTVSYDSSLQGILTGQGTGQLTVNGAAVTIDARAVSGASLTLDYYTDEANATPFKVGLLPGAHILQAHDGQSSVAFTVNADGTVSYDPSLQGILTGQGTGFLTVQGVAVAIDAQAITASSLILDYYTDEANATPFLVGLLPGAHILQALDGQSSVAFTVNPDGTVSYDPSLQGILTGQGTGQLSVHGAAVTIDAQAIAGSSLILDYYTVEPNAKPFLVGLLPGAHLLQALDGHSSVAFTVNPDGTVSYNPSLQGILTGQGTEQLTVNGDAVTIDARAITGSSLILDYYSDEPNATPFLVGLLPGAHILQALDGQSSVAFTVNPDGTVSYDPSLQGILTGQGTGHLTVQGVAVAIDAQAITGSSLTLDYYTDEPNAKPFLVHLLPGAHILQALDGQSSVAFAVNADGTVSYDSSLQGILTGQGTSQLTVRGAAITIDATALRDDPSLTLDYYTTEPNAAPFQTVLLPGTHVLAGVGGQVTFTVNPDGTISYPASENDLLSGLGGMTLIVKALS